VSPRRANEQERKRAPSQRSLRGLDGLNFLLADVRDGLGPYLAVFLKAEQHWSPGAIGIAMAASSIATAFCQIPAGLLVDSLRFKRLLVAVSGLLVAAGCLLVAFHPQLAAVVAAQVTLGAASAVIPPALAALSLGLVGHRRLDARISRNESFNHGGNFIAAGMAGSLGYTLGYDWIFYLVCFFAVASAAVVNLINPAEIDHELARGGEERDTNGQFMAPLSVRELFARKDLVIFLISVVLFHFGNAAMLPMAGQVLAQTHPGSDTIALSACIIAAQLIMVGALRGRWARRWRLALAGSLFFWLPWPRCRYAAFCFHSSRILTALFAIQLLDGVAAGIFGVIAVVIASDLMRGTGRFNLAQGLVRFASA